MFYLYILHSEKNGRFYVGSTAILTDRILRHNQGRSKATKAGIPWSLVYTEEFDSRAKAMKREMEIKAWKSHQRIALLVSASRSDGL
jgi:putative endonuclease